MSNLYAQLQPHVGHRLMPVAYADATNISLECLSCMEVVFDSDIYELVGVSADTDSPQPTDTFLTSDGYRLQRQGELWTDGDLSYEAHHGTGGPIDDFGDFLEGSYIQA